MRTIALGLVASAALSPAAANAEGPCLKPFIWSAPSRSELAEVYPPRAMMHGIAGNALLVCDQTAFGRLVSCAVGSEWPSGYGFGSAALKLAPGLKYGGCADMPDRIIRYNVQIPIRFSLSG
jgi:hypothetical protein